MRSLGTTGGLWLAIGAIAGATAVASARAIAECGYVGPDPDRAGLTLVSATVDDVQVDADTLATYATYDVIAEATADGVDLRVEEHDGEMVAVEVWQ